jgi:alkane 1-monooxygenase
MDRRVLAHFGGDITRANISPRRRDAILARYPVSTTGGVSGGPERASRGLASAAAADAEPHGAARPTRRPSSEGAPGTASVPTDAEEALAWRCPGCHYTYDVVVGEEREGFAAGTAWSEIPDTWCCPDCGVRDKVDFVAVEREVAS